MAWVRLDDQFFRHHKARAAGKDGRELFLASCCYAAAGLTDGFIPAGDLPLLAAEAGVKPATAKTLVDVGLWHVVEHGWMIHDFTEINPTAKDVKERRRQARERQDRWRRARNASRDAATNGVSDAVTNAPPYPDPTRKGQGSGSHLQSVPSPPAPAAEGGAGSSEEPPFDPEVMRAGAERLRAIKAALR